MNGDASAIFGNLFGEELQQQKDASELFNARFTENADQMKSLYGSVLEGMNKKKTPELPPEVQGIVSGLMAQPRLIVPTKNFLEEKVAAISAAVDSILGPLPQDKP